MTLTTLILAVVALILGVIGGYLVFRYGLTGKYKQMMAKAEKEAEDLKKEKLFEVKEKFLNKKAELEKEVQQRNDPAERKSPEAARNRTEPASGGTGTPQTGG